MTELRFTLPLPPPLSALTVNVARGGRVSSARYKEWQAEAYAHFQGQRELRCIQGPVSVSYFLGRPNKRRQDCFNREKALSDFLTRHKIIDDDSCIECALIAWTNEHPGEVTIIVRPANQQQGGMA